MTVQETIEVSTTGHRGVYDLTPDVTAIVRRSGVRTGVAHVFVQGSTGALGLMECERGLKQDLPQLLDRLAPRIRDAGVEVDVDVDPGLSQAITDPTRVAQVLTNLIDNAVKFSPRGAKVTVRATIEGDRVAISVSDKGPGIPKGERDAIFREFYRGKGEAVQAKTGVGLGLAIARRVARLLEGELSLESETGKGSTFWLRMPYRIPGFGGEVETTDAGMRPSGSAERQHGADR